MPSLGATATAATTAGVSLVLWPHITTDVGSLQYLLSAIAQSAAAVLALVLTANLLFGALNTPYHLPPRFLVRWDSLTLLTYLVLSTTLLVPLVLLATSSFAWSALAIYLMVASVLVLPAYFASRSRTTSLHHFIGTLVRKRALRRCYAGDLQQTCLDAQKAGDMATYFAACALLFSTYDDEQVVDAAIEDNAAVAVLIDAMYACASPLAEAGQTAIHDYATPVMRWLHANDPCRLTSFLAKRVPNDFVLSSPVNPFWDFMFAGDVFKLLGRLFASCEGRPWKKKLHEYLVRLLIDQVATDYFASCHRVDSYLEMSPGASWAPWKEETVMRCDSGMLRAMLGEAGSDWPPFDEFTMMGNANLGWTVSQDARELMPGYLKQAWNDVVAFLYRELDWRSQEDFLLCLYDQDQQAFRYVRGPSETEAAFAELGSDLSVLNDDPYATLPGGHEEHPGDGHPTGHQDEEMYLVVAAEETDRDKAERHLNRLLHHLGSDGLAFVIDKSDHYEGIPSGQWIVMVGTTSEAVATAETEFIAWCADVATKIVKVVKRCDDPISLLRRPGGQGPPGLLD